MPFETCDSRTARNGDEQIKSLICRTSSARVSLLSLVGAWRKTAAVILKVIFGLVPVAVSGLKSGNPVQGHRRERGAYKAHTYCHRFTLRAGNFRKWAAV